LDREFFNYRLNPLKSRLTGLRAVYFAEQLFYLLQVCHRLSSIIAKRVLKASALQYWMEYWSFEKEFILRPLFHRFFASLPHLYG
jgi:hypothetical protein